MASYTPSSNDHIEYNQARWVGVRLGDRGTPLYVSNFATGATVILHTVAVNTELHIYNSWLAAYPGGGPGSCLLEVFDTTPAQVYAIGHVSGLNAGDRSHRATMCRIFPVLVPAGYSVRIRSTTAGITVYGGIEGMVVPV